MTQAEYIKQRNKLLKEGKYHEVRILDDEYSGEEYEK